MAQCKITAQEFIQNAFSPMVAVQCSQDAENICLKNNLSFVELIQPFCRLTTEGHIRDPTSMLHVVRNMRIVIKDVFVQPPQPTIARKILNEVVAKSQPSSILVTRGNVVTIGDYNLQLNNSDPLEIDLAISQNVSTPWFEAYRETFLQVAYPYDHEFLRHFIACIFVVSSAHSNPVEHFNKMNQEQLTLPPSKMPKWFCPTVFKYYVLLHDVTVGDEAKAEAVYQNMKAVFGAPCCHLLQINSRALHVAEHNVTRNEDIGANLPDPWSQFLNKIIDHSGSSPDNGDEDIMIQTPPEDLSSAFPNTVIECMDSDISMTDSVEVSFSSNPAEEAMEAVESPGIQENTEVISHPLQPDFGSPTSPTDPFKREREIIGDCSTAPLIQCEWNSERNRNLPHGICLTVSDIDRIRIFIQEFCVRGLLPFVERQLRILNEQVTTQKGLRRSILSATKKWFGGNKPAGQGLKAPTNTVVYSHDSPELQIRRLGDLAFMFQLFELAYQSYHTAKRDFNNDQAWLYYAGALEMACLSVFMQGQNSQRPYPHHYMETAISTYLNTCKVLHLATRAVLFSTEALKSCGLWMEAAMQFIKMTSEESDLRSALLLEQAAHCYCNMPNPMVRKYAFQMILAGHRFSKAGQRKHALRCYRQALQVYKGKNWSLAEDHINFTIGRQSFNLKQLENATIAFKHLLTRYSKQVAAQQGAYLREYLFVYKQLLSQSGTDGNISNNSLPQLPLPYIDNSMTKVLLGVYQHNTLVQEEKIPATGVDFEHEELDNSKWFLLEQLAVSVAYNGVVPLTHKPTIQCFTSKTNNSSDPIAVVGESITVELLLKNPLKIQLVLTDASLLWRFIPVKYQDAGVIKYDPITNEKDRIKMSLSDEILHTQVVPEIIINELESKVVHLCLIPQQTGELHITGVAYNLGTQSSNTTTTPFLAPLPVQTKPSLAGSIFVRGKQSLEVQGPRLNNTKSEKTSNVPLYGPDRRLDPIIVPKMPLLEVYFSNFPTSLLCEEIHLVDVEFVNLGSCPLTQLLVASTNPELFSFGSAMPSNNGGFGSMYQTLIAASQGDWNELLCKSHNISQVCEVPIPGSVLAPGATVKLPLWIRGADTSGIHEMDFLFFYQSKETNPRLRHRILHHTAVVNVSNSLSLHTIARRGVTGGTHTVIEPEHLVVSLEIENLNQIHDSTITEMDIIQVSCASKNWSLQPFSSVTHKEPVKIKARETACLCFKALHCKYNRQDPADDTIVITNVTFQHTQINSAVSPCIDFYYRSKMKRPKLTQEFGSPVLRRHAKENKKEDLLNEKLQQALQVGLTLIVLWKAFVVDDTGQNHVILGQHHVTAEIVDTVASSQSSQKLSQDRLPVRFIKNPLEALKEQKADLIVLSQLVHCCMHHGEKISHNFNGTRFCLLPVSLVLYNCCDIQLKVVVDTSKTGDSGIGSSQSSSLPNFSSIYQIPYIGTFTWVCCNITSVDIAPHSSQTVTLTACFSKPGVYNLSGICVAAAYHTEIPTHSPTFIPQKPMAPSLILVTKELKN